MAARGRPPHPDILTPTEWRVLDLVRHGMSNRRIARAQGVSLEAVKFHTGNIRSKLGLGRRAALRTWSGAPAGSPLTKEGAPIMTATKLGHIGQVALTVKSLERAEPFYRDVLGLPHLYTFGNLAFFDCDGTRLFLTAAEDEAHSRNHSVLYFTVPDIKAAHKELLSRGVAFEAAPHLIHRHDSGVEEWMAFFEDPDGNTLALMSQVGP